MRVLHFCKFDAERISGPALSVQKLAEAQRLMNDIQEVRVVNVHPNRGQRHEELLATDGARDNVFLPNGSCDLVHFHGVYHMEFPALAQECRKRSIPYVVCPRSNLMRTAMQKSWLKKFLGNVLVFDRFVRQATGRHFLTADEASHSRFGTLPGFIAGNGVALPEDILPPIVNPPRFCYIGRLDVVHKGLDLLLDGVYQARERLREQGARIQIFGPDQNRGEEQLLAIAAQRQILDLVQFGPAVRGAEKDALLQQASVFVHTSRYEGQPQAVLEAWAHGRPAIVTGGTNLGTISRDHGTGWLTGDAPEQIAATLREVVDNPWAIVNKGRAARVYAQQCLTWDQAAEETLAGYGQMLHRRMLSVA